MSNIKNEVITKLRSDIREKLDQIGAFVDNELADYIMVLVANQKSKYQMKDDLSLFLGATTDEFVNWLHTTLKQIQLNANLSEDKKSVTTDDKESKETKDLSKKSNLSHKIKHKKHLTKSDKSSENSGSVDVIEGLKESNGVNPLQKSDENENQSENVLSDKQNNENERQENDINENKEPIEGDVILHLKPDGGDVDELLQENDVNDNKVENKEQPKAEERTAKTVKAVPLKRQISSTPSSTIGAVVVNKPKRLEEEEDDYDPSRPVVGSVASVVCVTKRKSSVPIELQANKNLLLRAVKDANESMHPNRKRGSDALDYTPTPIKKRLGEKQDKKVLSNDSEEQDLDPKDLRNYLNVSKKDSDKTEDLDQNINQKRKVKQIIEYKQTEELNPQFVVTLDGVDHNKYLQNDEFNDRITFDEEMDEEFVESQDMIENENLENSDLSANKVNEKCRFWPSCKNGDECEFLHPTTPCKTFPNCRFGDKCIYIHPNCKFDSMCSRRDCPFTHASRRKIPNSAIISSLLPPNPLKQCKYVPNCKNLVCPYYHPKICRFGSKCRSHSCPFIHPTISYSAQPSVSVPHPNQLKWKAKTHISERQFSKSTEKDSKTLTIS